MNRCSGIIIKVLIGINILSVALMLASCGPRVFKHYDGAQLNQSEKAVIKLEGALLCGVDGKSWKAMDIVGGNKITSFGIDVEVLPGRHNISVAAKSAGYMGMWSQTQCINLNIEVEAGHTYILLSHLIVTSHKELPVYGPGGTISHLKIDEEGMRFFTLHDHDIDDEEKKNLLSKDMNPGNSWVVPARWDKKIKKWIIDIK